MSLKACACASSLADRSLKSVGFAPAHTQRRHHVPARPAMSRAERASATPWMSLCFHKLIARSTLRERQAWVSRPCCLSSTHLPRILMSAF